MLIKEVNLFFLLLILSSGLFAEEAKLKKPLLERMIEPKLSLDSSYLSDASVSGSDASLGVSKNSIRINNAIGSLSYSNWNFAWRDIVALPFGDGVDSPIEQMHSIKLSVNIPYFINDDWFMLTSVSMGSTFERESENSYSGGLFSFAAYKLSENHSLTLGAFANYHPIATLALPIMSYSYRAREIDGFQLILGFPRAYVGYFVNERTLLRCGVIFSQSVIRLSNASVIESAGFIEAEDYMSNAGISYEIDENFTIDADILYSIKRNFIFYNSSGEELKSYNIDPSLGANIRLKYIF